MKYFSALILKYFQDNYYLDNYQDYYQESNQVYYLNYFQEGNYHDYYLDWNPMESLHEVVLPVHKDSKVSKLPFPQFLTVGPQDPCGWSVGLSDIIS